MVRAVHLTEEPSPGIAACGRNDWANVGSGFPECWPADMHLAIRPDECTILHGENSKQVQFYQCFDRQSKCTGG